MSPGVGFSPDNRSMNLQETRPDDVKKMLINMPQEKFRGDWGEWHESGELKTRIRAEPTERGGVV